VKQKEADCLQSLKALGCPDTLTLDVYACKIWLAGYERAKSRAMLIVAAQDPKFWKIEAMGEEELETNQ